MTSAVDQAKLAAQGPNLVEAAEGFESLGPSFPWGAAIGFWLRARDLALGAHHDALLDLLSDLRSSIEVAAPGEARGSLLWAEATLQITLLKLRASIQPDELRAQLHACEAELGRPSLRVFLAKLEVDRLDPGVVDLAHDNLRPDVTQTVEELEAVVEPDAAIATAIGRWYQSRNDWSAATNYYRAALDRFSRDQTAAVWLLYLQRVTNHASDSALLADAEQLLTWVRIPEERADLLTELGVLNEEHHPGRAAECYREALAVRPADVFASRRLAAMHLRLG